jgi:hypothetical protein
MSVINNAVVNNLQYNNFQAYNSYVIGEGMCPSCGVNACTTACIHCLEPFCPDCTNGTLCYACEFERAEDQEMYGQDFTDDTDVFDDDAFDEEKDLLLFGFF